MRATAENLSRSEVYSDLAAAMQPARRPMPAGKRLDLKHWHYHTAKAAEWRAEAALYFTKVVRYPAYSGPQLAYARECTRSARKHLETAASLRRLMGDHFNIARAQ